MSHHLELGGGLSLSWRVDPGYDQVEVVAQWPLNGQLHRSMQRQAIEPLVKAYGGEKEWMNRMAEWARGERAKTMPSNDWQQAMAVTNSTGNTTWMQGTSANSSYVAPPIWHSFACGHQLKLEHGQPTPMVCPTCGPVVMETYTYEKCGHPYSHPRNLPVPSACPECARLAIAAERERGIREGEIAAEAKRREEEAKDPVAWLDRELGGVYATL